MPKDRRQGEDERGSHLSRRERLADRFGNWPLLRLLIYSFWFRLAFLGMLGTMLTLALMLPRMWRVTPSGFRPEVKARLLDFVQAWSLRRTAVAQEAVGNYPAAFNAWRAAWGYNLANKDTIRRLLAVVPKLDQPENQMGTIVQGGGWLLRLGGTNLADIELTTRAWVKAGLSDRAATLLDPQRLAMPPRLEQLYLMALFEAQRKDEFASRMNTNSAVKADLARVLRSPAALHMDSAGGEPEFPLFCAAYFVGWGDQAARSKGLEVLHTNRTDRGTETLAYDLEFLAAWCKRDTDTCGEILHEIDEPTNHLGHAKIRQYTDYWRLLIADGRKADAQTNADYVNPVPANALDAYRLASVLVLLGREDKDKAEKLLQRFTENVGWAAELLVLQGDVLEQAGKWDELRQLALRIRLQPESMDLLGGYSYFLEGLATWHTTPDLNDRKNYRLDRARESFQQAVTNGFSTPGLALKVGTKFLALPGGVGAVWAKQILLDQRSSTLTNDPTYWQALMKCAGIMHDDGHLMEAASNCWRLRPNDPVAINNYAAALLIFRQRPEEAIALTLRLARDYPRSVDMQMNHAAALALNDRVEEADQVLQRINPSELTSELASQYYLTKFEIYWKSKRLDLARTTAARIDQTLLYPVQAAWLTNIVQQLGTVQPTPASKRVTPGP